MKNIIFNLKREYFNQIKNGEKRFEYRLMTEYWRKRLENKEYNLLILKLGYPRDSEKDKILILIYNGYEIQRIKHKHFGENEVDVYAIKIGDLNN